MQLTYQELFPEQDFAHLARTVEQYFSKETPLWWVEQQNKFQQRSVHSSQQDRVACLWAGNAIDQVQGDRYTHVFILYVVPEHRHQGIGTALMRYAEAWAKARGDRQIGLQVFLANQKALNLYHKLGYQTQSLWMSKALSHDREEEKR